MSVNRSNTKNHAECSVICSSLPFILGDVAIPLARNAPCIFPESGEVFWQTNKYFLLCEPSHNFFCPIGQLKL